MSKASAETPTAAQLPAVTMEIHGGKIKARTASSGVIKENTTVLHGWKPWNILAVD